LLLANNWVGWKAAEYLKTRRDNVVGVVVHPPHKQKYRDEIVSALSLPDGRVFDGARLHEPAVLEEVRSLNPQLGLSVLFDYILKPEFLRLVPAGVVNLHPSLLPFNRGNYPNVWSIVEETPAGVTLHYIDEGIDTGEIIAQHEVPVDVTDTGETLYRKLEQACLRLLKQSWPRVVTGEVTSAPQPEEQGTYHRASDVELIDRIDLDAVYQGRKLMNVLRARTFPPYDGAYFVHQGRRVYMRLELYTKAEEGENAL